MSNRIDQYLRTSQVNGVIFDGEEISRKRPAAEDISQPAKKMRPDESVQVTIDPAISTAFLLDPSNVLALYEARSIPLSVVVEIIVKIMEILPPQLLEDRLNVFHSLFVTNPSL